MLRLASVISVHIPLAGVSTMVKSDPMRWRRIFILVINASHDNGVGIRDIMTGELASK